MKKIFGLLTALLVAVACMTFTSCATDNTDLKFGQSPLTALQGDFSPDSSTPINPVSTGDTVVFTFTYADTMNAWGGGNGTLNFKGHSNAGKNDYAYGPSDVTIESLPAGVEKGSGDNIQLKGLVAGTTYTFSFFTIPTLSLTVTAN